MNVKINIFKKISFCSYFPADFQECHIVISLPATDYHVVELTTPGNDKAVVVEDSGSLVSSLWKLEGQTFEIGSQTSTPTITFSLLLARRSAFYVAAMMVPILLINAMVAGGMLLPPLAPKKVAVAFVSPLPPPI